MAQSVKSTKVGRQRNTGGSLLELDFDHVAFDPKGPVAPQITGALRDLIKHNILQPGQRLSEAEISGRFGFSRQPVREAFIKLAEESLLEIRPQRGTYVRKISLAAVMDARFVREAIEADVVRLCASQSDAALVRELRDQLAAQQREAEKPAPSFVPLDDLFHRTLCESVGHPNAWAVIESLKSQLDRVRQMATEQFPLSELVAQHAAIVDAIEQHEPAAAESSLRLHLQRILSDLPKIRERYADLFEPT